MSPAARGFSLIDVMVSLAVIALLIGLMLPAIASARETARRVVCASNQRQVGLGLALYAEDYDEYLVPSASVWWDLPGFRSRHIPPMFEADSVRLKFANERHSPFGTPWDGLGILYAHEYLPAPGLFYCPSHDAGFDFSTFADQWAGASGRIDGNYQYRGRDASGNRTFARITPRSTALVSDGLRSLEEFNHADGTNVLRADLVVRWVLDQDQRVTSLLPSAVESESGTPAGPGDIDRIWDAIDDLNPN